MTIRTWIQLPVCGKLGLMFRPKKPSSHRINRITTIVHNMRFLLLSDSLSMMILHGGLSVAHQLQDLELIDPYGPVLILQQTLPDRIHRSGSICLHHLGEVSGTRPWNIGQRWIFPRLFQIEPFVNDSHHWQP